jgi:dipeptidyl aminopeptidase/acylaminoacyl peptidase
MTGPKVAPYGAWKSPISSASVVERAIGFGQVAVDADTVYWSESRPHEGGRSVIVSRSADGTVSDLTPTPFNARTRVHEYGGGAFVVGDGRVVFSNFADQRLYRLDPGGEPRPITADGPWRYADAVVDGGRDRLICVREDHGDGTAEPVNEIVAVGLDGRDEGGRVLVSGADFYASPRLSPDGRQLAWLAWNHPNMPWDGCELWLAEMGNDGALGDARCIAGGVDESIFQPEWSPDGVLHFVSDRSGWWNLCRWQDGAAEALCPMEAEFGKPQWAFGMSTYNFETATRLVCAYTREGRWHLARLDRSSGKLEPRDAPAYSSLDGVRVGDGKAYFVAATPSEPAALIELDLETGESTVLHRSAEVAVDAGYLSTPEAVEFPTDGGLTAHAYYYPPCNRDFAAPEGEKPPLLVKSHGGPTGATADGLRLAVQYWTSRGFAVLDVNYGGSTGYGRAYRARLDGQWGVVDLDDCVNGARFLVARGDVDPERLAISGGSAGGYTTLCALAFRDTFKAGASHYGIGDLEALARDTHKFESRYLDQMIGPYPARADLYRERSPIYHTEGLSCPVIFFQGLDDKVVPPAQAEAMVAALREKGLPVAYVPFEGEQHGFRQAANIRRALDGEFCFYGRIFGFIPADDIDPVPIENL